MFKADNRTRNRWVALYEMAALTYHMTVRSAGGASANPTMTLVINLIQTAIMIAVFYYMMSLLGMRSNSMRGDFVVFLMVGIMGYMTFVKALKAVYGADGPVSPMMQHPQMNTVIAITASALGALYTQFLTAFCILFGYHVAITPIDIEYPALAVFLMLASWMFGIAVGLVLLSIRPWAPKIAPIIMAIIMRVNIIASGKMVVGNSLSFGMLKIFDWNPLFHCIDQMRGAMFSNYTPRNSEILYIFEVTAALLVIGLMLEFVTSKKVSASWFAR